MKKFHKRLFKSIYGSVDSLETQTPLGMIRISAEFSLNGILHKPSVKLKKGSLFVLDYNDFYAEIVKLSITPKIPKQMQVDECIAYLVRFKCLKSLQPRFNCTLDFTGEILEPNPESGEHLISQNFANADFKLTIGTEDEESLGKRAADQLWLPHRLSSDNLLSYENVECISNGVQIIFPTFLEQEIGQIQFVISWTQVKINNPLSTWFAVEISPNEILKQVCT